MITVRPGPEDELISLMFINFDFFRGSSSLFIIVVSLTASVYSLLPFFAAKMKTRGGLLYYKLLPRKLSTGIHPHFIQTAVRSHVQRLTIFIAPGHISRTF